MDAHISINKKKIKMPVKIVAIISAAIFLTIIGLIIGLSVSGAKDSVVIARDSNMQIKGIYGLTLRYSDIKEISLIETSMDNIGVGKRRNGYGGKGQTFKGHFEHEWNGKMLLFVQAETVPTIKIERKSGKDIYISFLSGNTTRELFEELMQKAGSAVCGDCNTENWYCERHQSGVYVRHILFAFSEEETEYFMQYGTDDGGIDAEGYAEMEEAAAQLVALNKSDGEERPLFGQGGVYDEMENALKAQTGQAALDIFEEYLIMYNSDAGMEDGFNEKGYFVPLEGNPPYLQTFKEISRKLFNQMTPEASVGNAFIDGKLGYGISYYGVHIAIIKSISLR